MTAVPWCCGMNAMSDFGRPGPVGDVDAVGDVALEDLRRDLGLELVVDVSPPDWFSMNASGFSSLPMSW